MISRRRLLQVLAAAPFAPWKEILEEAAKPKIFYSIPPLAYGKSPLEILAGDINAAQQRLEAVRDYYTIEWPVASRSWSFTTQDVLDEMHIQNVAYRYGIPRESLETMRQRLMREPPRKPREFKYPLIGNLRWTPKEST